MSLPADYLKVETSETVALHATLLFSCQKSSPVISSPFWKERNLPLWRELVAKSEYSISSNTQIVIQFLRRAAVDGDLGWRSICIDFQWRRMKLACQVSRWKFAIIRLIGSCEEYQVPLKTDTFYVRRWAHYLNSLKPAIIFLGNKQIPGSFGLNPPWSSSRTLICFYARVWSKKEKETRANSKIKRQWIEFKAGINRKVT